MSDSIGIYVLEDRHILRQFGETHIGSRQPTNGQIVVYIDYVHGDDNNVGTILTEPLQTKDAALRMRKRLMEQFIS